MRWHVRHCENYIKAHSARLKEHCGKTVDEYLQAKGRNIYLKDYQYFQMVDALRILFVDVPAAVWAFDYSWDGQKERAKSLEKTHPTIAKVPLLENTVAIQTEVSFIAISNCQANRIFQ